MSFVTQLNYAQPIHQAGLAKTSIYENNFNNFGCVTILASPLSQTLGFKVQVSADCLTESGLLEIARRWVNVLANEDYETVFNSLGYAMSYQTPELSGSESIKSAIKSYRSERYYPGVTDFFVSEWESTAGGGNPNPFWLIRFYYPNDLKIKATIEFDLPLNGKWSDLEASFVIFEVDSNRYELNFESIFEPSYEDSE